MAQRQAVDIPVVVDRKRKLALREALQTALEGHTGQWRVVVRAVLIYETPKFGS